MAFEYNALPAVGDGLLDQFIRHPAECLCFFQLADRVLRSLLGKRFFGGDAVLVELAPFFRGDKISRWGWKFFEFCRGLSRLLLRFAYFRT